MTLSHNLTAANACGQLKITTSKQRVAAEKLSSGYRINKAADDAAGLSISEKLRWQIRGLDKGVGNTEQGIDVCQVADGALSEVTDMLNRIKELCVQAANDINTQSDRQAIQREINELTMEIDRIGKDTTYNTIPLFRGTDVYHTDASGNPIINGNIGVDQIQLVDIDLGRVPFDANSTGSMLNLQAIPDNGADVWNLVWKDVTGDTSTSQSSFRFSYTTPGGATQTMGTSLNAITPTNFRIDRGADGLQVWKRDFQYTNADGVDVTITQCVKPKDIGDGSEEKAYEITYEMKNNSGFEVDADFMFHVDTAYNSNDYCEGYYIGGAKVDKRVVYVNDAANKFTQGGTSSDIITGIPGDMSIIDVDSALSFSEKVVFTDTPDVVSIGYYLDIRGWNYYNNIKDNTNTQLGTTTDNLDLGFCAIWNKKLTAGATQSFGVQYGIQSTAADQNLDGVPVNTDTSTSATHSPSKKMWIQQGAIGGDGIFLEIGELTLNSLGIDRLDVGTYDRASNAMDAVDQALAGISLNRSKIGAQQNRLEHTALNNSNISENTQAAESRLRDTDMAEAMVEYSKNNILQQAGQAMLANANHSGESVLKLIQGS